MDNGQIINYLEENQFNDIDEILQEDYSLITFYYDFDKCEIEAAKSYANEESDYEAESEQWYSEFYVPYLKDIAVDNVESIVEEIIDEFEVECKYKEIGSEDGDYSSLKFVIGVSDEIADTELEEIVNEYCD